MLLIAFGSLGLGLPNSSGVSGIISRVITISLKWLR